MTTASSRDTAPRGNGQGRSMTGPVGSFVVRRARLVLVAAMLAVAGFGVLGVGAFGKLQTGGFQDPGAESTIAQTLTDQRFGGSDGVGLLVHAEAAQEGPDHPNVSVANEIPGEPNGKPTTTATRPRQATPAVAYRTCK